MRVADFFEPVCSEAVIGHRVERVPASPMLRRGDTIRWAASRPAAVPWPRDFDGGARCRRGGDRRGRRAARAASASAHLSGPHLRLSDERPRLRAAGGSAGSGRHNKVAQVEIAEALQQFPSSLPSSRESAYAAWVSISVGCNNSCTFCIVPSLRGREVDRSPADILAEVRSLVNDGVLEVTLLGQNVNAYGVSFADPALPRNRGAFAELLRACGDIDGLERVRFTSPHPAEFTDDVIEAMAQTRNVCPALHMPLQSGSDRILRAMRRSYRAERYLGIIERVRAAIPHAAITTDLIVGFPGETEEDFAATLDVVRRARFAAAFTFQYSKRPGTPAAQLDGQLPKAVVQERYERLIALQEQISLEANRALVGQAVEVLVATGEGRKDTVTARMSGRARDGRLVHFTAGQPRVRPGDVITTKVTEAAPHHLIADAGVLTHRRTRAGDAHTAGQPGRAVGLGMPGVGLPVSAAKPGGCR